MYQRKQQQLANGKPTYIRWITEHVRKTASHGIEASQPNLITGTLIAAPMRTGEKIGNWRAMWRTRNRDQSLCTAHPSFYDNKHKDAVQKKTVKFVCRWFLSLRTINFVTPLVLGLHNCTCISWTWASFIHSLAYITWNMLSKYCNMLYILWVLFLWNE